MIDQRKSRQELRQAARDAFGRALKAEREARTRDPDTGKPMSVQQLSQECGFSANTVQGWEAGTSEPEYPEKGFAVERHLGVPPGSLTRLLGYVPPDVEVECSVPAAVAADERLGDNDRDVLLRVWRMAMDRDPQ